MAEHRLTSERQYRRHPYPFIAQSAVPDRIHPSMKTVKPAGGNRPLYGAGRDT
jgi:hypothetical protein